MWGHLNQLWPWHRGSQDVRGPCTPSPTPNLPCALCPLATRCESTRKWQGAGSGSGGHRLEEREDSNLHSLAPPSASSQQRPNLQRNLPRGGGEGGVCQPQPQS